MMRRMTIVTATAILTFAVVCDWMLGLASRDVASEVPVGEEDILFDDDSPVVGVGVGVLSTSVALEVELDCENGISRVNISKVR